MFDARQYTIRRRAGAFGSEHVVTAGMGESRTTILRAKHQFRPKSGVRFTDPGGRPTLRVEARRAGAPDVDASGNREYAVGDPRTESYVGAVSRRVEPVSGHRWEIYGRDDGHVGGIVGSGRLRRFVPRPLQSVLPFTRSIVGADGETLGTISRSWPSRDRVHVDCTQDTDDRLDPRLVLATVAVGDRTRIVGRP